MSVLKKVSKTTEPIVTGSRIQPPEVEETTEYSSHPGPMTIMANKSVYDENL